METNLLDVITELKKIKKKIESKKVLIGFDGFIDKITRVVDKRKSPTEYTCIKTIKDYGDRILGASNKSANMEFVVEQKKAGGNAPLMSLALIGMGIDTTLVGLTGNPTKSVFRNLEKKATLLPLGNPGQTIALEFNDGKLMLGNNLKSAYNVSWKQIKKKIGSSVFKEKLLNSDLVACTNWTMLPKLDSIIEKIISYIPSNNKTTFFFDLADPQKRQDSEIKDVLKQIHTLNKKAKCILGLNLKESERLCSILNISTNNLDDKKIVQCIKDKISIYGVIIHNSHFACSAMGKEIEYVKSLFESHPKITTGAGDHFNGGFCAGYLGNLSLKNCLYTGVATSGWYIRNGGPSPNFNNVIEMLKHFKI